MTTSDRPNNDLQASDDLPLWRRPDWTGPSVERRPDHAGLAEWPEGAVERVVFLREAFPEAAFPECLPFTETFGADGWPLRTPDSVKSRLDPRMQAELRRYPWTCRPYEWSERTWLSFASDYDAFSYRQAENHVLRGLITTELLPAPHPRS